MKRKPDLVEEAARWRRKLEKELQNLDPREQEIEIRKRAAAVLADAGVKPKWINGQPQRVHRKGGRR